MRKVLLSFLLFPVSSFAYDISTCQDLQNMQKDLSASYQLTQDIDCSNFIWNPISGVFSGKLNGQDHRITNLMVAGKQSVSALFESLEHAEIYNLKIEEAGFEWHSKTDKTEAAMGFVAATAKDSVITNLKLYDVKVIAHNVRNAGLIIGDAQDVLLDKVTIENSFLDVSAKYAGLMVGSFVGTAGRYDNKGVPLTGIMGSKVLHSQIYASHPLLHSGFGGLAGYADTMFTLNNILEKVTIAPSKTAANIEYAGAISGITEVKNNYILFNKISDVSISRANFAGGMFGKLKVESCFLQNSFDQNFVESSLQVAEMGAGFAAEVHYRVKEDKCLISNNAIQTNISSVAHSYPVGAGFIGLLENDGNFTIGIEHNYVAAILDTASLEDRVGFIYAITKDITPAPQLIANFWDKDIAQTSTALPIAAEEGVQALSSAEMKNPTNYVDAGWNFEKIWYVPNGSYPRLMALDIK
jgi:hypothetical protein